MVTEFQIVSVSDDRVPDHVGEVQDRGSCRPVVIVFQIVTTSGDRSPDRVDQW